jgi:hypothetical protein
MHHLGLEDLPGCASILVGHPLQIPLRSPLGLDQLGLDPCRSSRSASRISPCDLHPLPPRGSPRHRSRWACLEDLPSWASILLGLSRSIQASLVGLLGFLGLSPTKEKAPDLSGASLRLSGLGLIQAKAVSN